MPDPHTRADIFNPAIMQTRRNSDWHGLHGCAPALAIARFRKTSKAPMLVIAESARQAEQLHDEIGFFLDPSRIGLFPDWECLPYDRFSPHQEIVSTRLEVLARLADSKSALLVVTLANLMQRLPPVSYISAHSFNLRYGDEIDLNAFRDRLADAAYTPVSQVMAPGEYAIRGGLVDVFPMGSPAPLRIDLFGDEIESLKHFDPQTQLTTGEIESIELLPAREFPLNEAGVQLFRRQFRKEFSGDPRQQVIYNDVSNQYASQGLEYYFPLFFEHTATLFDYLDENTVIVRPDTLDDQSGAIFADIQDRYDNAQDPQRKVLAPGHLYLDPDTLIQRLNLHTGIVLNRGRPRSTSFRYGTGAPTLLQVNPKSATPYQKLIDHIGSVRDRQILLIAETPGRNEAFNTLLSQHGLSAKPVRDWESFRTGSDALAITISPVERGLVLENELEIICENQLYGERSVSARKTAANRDPESIIRSLAELKSGDPVVHEDQGIGRYRGLKTLAADGLTNEYMVIEYQDKARLYVPVLSLHLISRYTSGSPENAPLHQLGSDQWQKIQEKAREKAYDVAVELLEMQAIRKARTGFSFEIDQPDMDLFAASFDYQETADQESAIAEVLSDMTSARPMDRLVCGDVGFGKTEVAIRASFVAAHNNRQVAMLVPTTLLAQQHYETFKDRFAGQAVEIRMLSRFRSAGQNRSTLDEISAGTVDIVIGTHRLLQNDIRFKKLGLLILDEEHRFGVRQKERIKQYRHEVDILTLTATPIPRTLNQTLSSMRDISIISTPPRDRLSVQTFVRERDPGLVKEAIQREIRRGGQVYYLHNDVRTIDRKAAQLQAVLPEIRIGIGHGQMPELQLETVMQDFYHRRFNVFVCTTIVESGIDNPSANTIIVNRADRFGLAQLHQLRGRVGRSHHQAYAYLLVDSFKGITRDAKKRLEAIASLKELGAGFTLASHDLEIRGAGELLGEAQSGTIDLVGFSLYNQYVNRAIRSLGRGDTGPAPANSQAGTEIDIQLPALLPESYIPDVHMRLVFYKRIASASHEQELHDLKIELADRFGLLPEPARLLLDLAGLRTTASQLGVTRIQLSGQGGFFEFTETPGFDPLCLVRLIQEQHQCYQLQGNGRLNLRQELPDKDQRLAAIRSLLDQLRE